MVAFAPTPSPFRFVHLLADEQRWRLIQELGRSDRKVSELTELLGKPQNLVSYHLASLREAGIVSARRSSADRRDAYYSIDMQRCADLLREVAPALHPGLRLDPVDPLTLGGRSGRRPRVLFLCTGNSARSQMAEGLLEQRSAGTVRVLSAGSHPKPVHANAVRVMAERGIDISVRRSKGLERFRNMRFDRVITLCDKVREICPQLPGAPATAHWSMPDPASEGASDEESYPAFRRTAEEIESRIPYLIGDLKAGNERRTPNG